MRRILVTGLAVIALIGSASAQEPKKPDANASTKTDASKDKKICKNTVVTGSIMTRRVCKTKDEWAVLSDKGQNDLQRSRDRGRSKSGVGLTRGGG